MYKIVYMKRAVKEIQYVKAAELSNKLKKLIDATASDPFAYPAKKLKLDLEGAYSKRINQQHRLVYEVDNTQNIIKIISVWGHYND